MTFSDITASDPRSPITTGCGNRCATGEELGAPEWAAGYIQPDPECPVHGGHKNPVHIDDFDTQKDLRRRALRSVALTGTFWTLAVLAALAALWIPAPLHLVVLIAVLVSVMPGCILSSRSINRVFDWRESTP